jgi:hypothetical protein
MPNQSNYRSDIINKTEPRFLASRIVQVPEDGVLNEQLPGSFGYDVDDVVELHFYTHPGNTLLFSTTIELNITDVLKVHNVEYGDGTFKNYLRVDFTKLFEEKNLILVPGEYRLVINLFSNEIGGYQNRNLVIEEVSNNRTEVQLRFRNPATVVELEKNKRDIREFVLPSFPKKVATLVAEQILRSGVTNNDPVQGLLYENIVERANAISRERVRRLGAATEQQIRENINQYILNIYEIVREELIISGDARIQLDEFFELVSAAVDDEIKQLVNTDGRISIT